MNSNSNQTKVIHRENLWLEMNTPKCLNYIVYRSATKRNKWDASIKSTITKRTISKQSKIKNKNGRNYFFFKSTKRETKTKKRDYWPFFLLWIEYGMNGRERWKKSIKKFIWKKKRKKEEEEDRWRIVSERIVLLYLIRKSRR